MERWSEKSITLYHYITITMIYSFLQMLLKAGVEGKQTVFLFSDNQIKDESFVEDINMILNTGDVPNIYPPDEKADIIEKMQAVARAQVSDIWLLWYIYTSVYFIVRVVR